MRFFTPDLFARSNSPDDDVAARAEEEWDEAIRAYVKHLDRIRDRMPTPIRQLADLCLHDAEVLSCELISELSLDGPLPNLLLMSVKQGDTLTNLLYFLSNKVRKETVKGEWPSPGSPQLWLYEELDESPTAPWGFVHRVLLSDGMTLDIPFYSVSIHSFSIANHAGGLTARQIA